MEKRGVHGEGDTHWRGSLMPCGEGLGAGTRRESFPWVAWGCGRRWEEEVGCNDGPGRCREPLRVLAAPGRGLEPDPSWHKEGFSWSGNAKWVKKV